MKFLKIFLLVILSIFLFFFSFLFMLNIGVERTVFNLEHYEDVVEELDVFSVLHGNLGGLMMPDDQPMGPEGEMMVSLLGEIFDEDWLETQFFVVIEEVLKFTEGEQETLEGTIDLGDAQALIEEQIMDELGMHEELSQVEMESIAQEIAEEGDIPSEIALSDLLEDPETKNAFSSIATFRTYAPIISYAVLGLVLIFMLLLAGISGGLKWFGTNMLLSGLVLFVFLISLAATLTPSFVAGFFEVPPELNILILIVKYTLSQMLIVPMIYGLIGLFLIISGVLFKKLRKKEKKV